MFRSRILILVILIFALMSACTPTTNPDAVEAPNPSSGQTTDEQTASDGNAPALPDEFVERETLFVFLDGQPVKEAGFAFSDIEAVMADKVINDTHYYAASIADIVGMDISSVKGVFLEAVDGYVSYVEDVNQLYLASYTATNDQYESISLDGKNVYGGVVEGTKDNKGVVNVFLVTTPATFEVEVQRNGEKMGVITLSDFLKKTEVGDSKVSTAMFDGSFLFNGGADTYQGRFLGISYETMLAKLASLNMDLSGVIIEVEYYGINGLGNVGKNTEYSLAEGDEKHFGSVDFYCMYDGKTYNRDTADTPIGLTAFINGTGGRWMTMNLSAINFIIE